MEYEIFIGGKKTIEQVMESGVKGLNPKTNRNQIIDKTAKYKMTKHKETLYKLVSDKDLFKIAKEKGLIL